MRIFFHRCNTASENNNNPINLFIIKYDYATFVPVHRLPVLCHSRLLASNDLGKFEFGMGPFAIVIAFPAVLNAIQNETFDLTKEPTRLHLQKMLAMWRVWRKGDSGGAGGE